MNSLRSLSLLIGLICALTSLISSPVNCDPDTWLLGYLPSNTRKISCDYRFKFGPGTTETLCERCCEKKQGYGELRALPIVKNGRGELLCFCELQSRTGGSGNPSSRVRGRTDDRKWSSFGTSNYFSGEPPRRGSRYERVTFYGGPED